MILIKVKFSKPDYTFECTPEMIERVTFGKPFYKTDYQVVTSEGWLKLSPADLVYVAPANAETFDVIRYAKSIGYSVSMKPVDSYKEVYEQ